jgi:hypothetical protein
LKIRPENSGNLSFLATKSEENGVRVHVEDETMIRLAAVVLTGFLSVSCAETTSSSGILQYAGSQDYEKAAPSQIIQTLTEHAENNATVIRRLSGESANAGFIKTKFDFVEGKDEVLFVAGFKEISPDSVSKLGLKPRPAYYALLFSPPYFGGIGKESIVRVLAVTPSGSVEWLAPNGQWQALNGVSLDASNKLKEYLTCSCGLTHEQLVRGWFERPDLPKYLKNSPFKNVE